VLSDFTMGRIGRAALAQHESALQKTATNLDVLANEVAKANRARDRLVIRGDSLRGQVALFESNLNQVTDAVVDLSTRVDAWLERAGSAHTPPLDDLVAVLQEIKQAAHQHAAAGLALQARAEKWNKTLKVTETDVSAVSATLADRQKSLHEQIERLRRLQADAAGRRREPLPRTGVTATEPGPPLAACGPSSKEPQGDDTSVAGTQATDCREINRFLRDVSHVRAALAARLRQMTKLSETADGLTKDLRVRETAIAQMGRDAAQANRTHEDHMARVERLGDSLASLSERHSAHDQRLLGQSNKIATVREELSALRKRLVAAATDAQEFGPDPTVVSAAEDLEAQALANRLENISVRVDTLKSAIVALKRPPPPPTKPEPPPAATSPEPDNDDLRVTESENARATGVTCNPALASCRRWLYLREQRALKANPAADDRLKRNNLDPPQVPR
jgi:chromosome segregation ATPase